MASIQRITDAGERRLLARMMGGGANPDLRLRLFANDATITSTMTGASFTAPAFVEYVTKSLAAANWTTPVTSDGKGDISHAEQSWSYVGAAAESIYGYFIDDPTDSTVILVHKFDTPRQVIGDGLIAVTPRLLAYDPSDV